MRQEDMYNTKYHHMKYETIHALLSGDFPKPSVAGMSGSTHEVDIALYEAMVVDAIPPCSLPVLLDNDTPIGGGGLAIDGGGRSREFDEGGGT